MVFVRHGGVFVRVPTCRLKKVRPDIEPANDSESQEKQKVIQKNTPSNDTIEGDEIEEITISDDEHGNVDAIRNDNTQLKKGDHIKFRKEDNGEWHTAEITSAAGKKTGKTETGTM